MDEREVTGREVRVRWSGRRMAAVAAFMVMVVVLASDAVAVPSNVRQGGSGFPLGGLWSWLFAGGDDADGGLPAVGGLPSQQSGTANGRDHYVSAAATRADGGAGRAPGRGVGAVDAYDPKSTPVVRSRAPRLAGDHSFHEGTSTRVASAASAVSDVYANTDGSFTRKVYEYPVNYRAADGSWQPVDRSLTRGRDGRLRQRAAGADVSFAAGAGDAALAAVRLDAGRAMSYGLLGAAEVPGEVSGDTVTYRGVLPGVDVRLAAVANGVKESVVLHSADAATSWVFPLQLQGLTPQLESGCRASEFLAQGLIGPDPRS